jgi:hypothetical protein
MDVNSCCHRQLKKKLTELTSDEAIIVDESSKTSKVTKIQPIKVHKNTIGNNFKLQQQIRNCEKLNGSAVPQLPNPALSDEQIMMSLDQMSNCCASGGNTLFPTCIKRPWVDIPGKCDTCYEIDRLRKSSEDSAVQLKCKEAHIMHRNGMFMLERKE